jgi:hypothetical protein
MNLWNTMSAYPFEAFSVPAYILFFILLWVGICKIISAAGGWRILAGDYQAISSFDGRKLWFKSVGMRSWTNYSNCITVGANKYGLYLSVLPIFRIGHPPLFFPWTDISTETVNRRLLPDMVKFRFTKQPEVPVIISKRLAAKIFGMRDENQRGFSE